MSKRRWYHYIVEGYSFPIDMLRYDCAFPATSEMASRIHHSIETLSASRQRVALIGTRLPTPDRWRSFGWRLVCNPEPIAPYDL